MQAHTYDGIRDFTAKSKKALLHEKEAEILEFQEIVKTNTAKDLQLMGLALTGLKFRSIKGGLYGRTLIILTHHLFPKDETPNKDLLDKSRLPECRFGGGDNVGIYDNSEYIQGKPLVSGVVHRRSEHKLIISLEAQEEGEDVEALIQDKYLSVCSTINEVTYHRYSKALDELESTDGSHKSKLLLQTLFNYVSYPSLSESKPIEFIDQSLNEQQKQAVAKCISTGSVHLVHGPPGTGKTKTVCEVIVQAVKRGWKVLATAGSNIAVDNIVERVGKNSKVCRIGHPSRMIEKVHDYCLDNLLFKSSFQKVLKDMKRELDQVRNKFLKTGDRAQRRDFKDKIKAMRSDIRGVEEAAIKEVLDESQVICCTNAGAGERMFRKELASTIFDLVVIDECAQSVEVSCWIPLLRGKRAVLAGDHLQLPPTIKSSAANTVLSYTLFDRAMKECPVENTLLTVQYRMHSMIMNWSSEQFYEGKLEADSSVSGHNIQQISTLATSPAPLMYIDTEGCQIGENIEKDSSDISKSKFNLGEADLVSAVCKELIEQGLKNEHIGVITPYNAQVSLIKDLLEPLQAENNRIEVSTVDGFQGREKECIIVSMVRSNPIKQVGFLSDQRRMNVAITRAKRFVCLIGDSDTVSSDPYLKTLVDYFIQNGEYKNAVEYTSEDGVRFGLGWVKHEKGETKDKDKDKDKDKEKNNHKDRKKEGSNKDKKKGKNSKREEKPITEINEVQLHRKLSDIPDDNENSPSLPQLQLKQLEDVEKIYLPMIEVWMSSAEKELVLEKLDGFERKVVHEIAENLGLNHKTSIDKKKLTLWKDAFSGLQQKHKEDIHDLVSNHKLHNLNFQSLQAETRKQLCQLAQELGLTTEYDEKKGELKVIRTQLKPSTAAKPQAPPQPQPKPKKKKEKKEVVGEVDELAYLEQLEADEKRCHFPDSECKAHVQHLGMRCQFCNQMFCVKHCLAESHGCDERAKVHAREKHKQEYQKSIGTVLSDKERDALRDRLQKKVKDAEKDRQKKVKPDKEKK